MHRALILAIPVILAGCAASIPPLPEPSTMPSTGPYDVGPALDTADKLAAQYARNYQRTAKDNRLLTLPTIAAATGAAVLTIANPAGVAQVLAFVGIGAGAYEIGRGALSPKSLPGLYLKGHEALTCIHAPASVFLVNQGATKDTGVEQLAARRRELGDQIATALFWEAKGLSGVTDGSEEERTAMQQSLTKLSEGIVRAKAAYTASVADEVAGRAAPATIRVAVSRIALKVASKGLEGTDLSYPTLLDQFKAMIPPKKDPTATGAPAIVADVITRTQKFDETLAALLDRIAAVENLQSAMPFAAALDQVKACPATVG
ncbi:hypothetical protein [Sandarakinorhabdus oryzae]|uniref:hypothetical protein n=1 Tax=Sandarakinorhabdus oryzae TaxID=2675220 RepID=UPI0012E111E8|nr:hypothetical protein [Sandarakinorhabdus oryzae]